MATLFTLGKYFAATIMLFVAKVAKSKVVGMFGVARFTVLHLDQFLFFFLFWVNAAVCINIRVDWFFSKDGHDIVDGSSKARTRTAFLLGFLFFFGFFFMSPAAASKCEVKSSSEKLSASLAIMTSRFASSS